MIEKVSACVYKYALDLLQWVMGCGMTIPIMIVF